MLSLTMVNTFFRNLTLIISIMYAVIKLKEFMLTKSAGEFLFSYFFVLLASGLSVLSLTRPFSHQNMIFDLRSVPVFIVTYILGWKKGLIAALLPSIYRWYVGGATAPPGIILDLLLPVLVGYLFYSRQEGEKLFLQLEIKNVVTSFLVFSFLRSGLKFLVLDLSFSFWLELTINLTLFSLGAVFVIAFMIQDYNQNLIQRKELKARANYDQMTKLCNLDYFKIRANQLMERGKILTVIMIDIDNFKCYNDTYGHPEGDEVLKQIGQILRDKVRGLDIAARYGGEEFIITIPDLSDTKEAFFIAERIRKAVEEYEFEGEEESQPEGCLTISLGISSLNKNKNLEALIEEADEALYAAKDAGRNKTVLFTELSEAD